jgi:hypothetical protein
MKRPKQQSPPVARAQESVAAIWLMPVSSGEADDMQAFAGHA